MKKIRVIWVLIAVVFVVVSLIMLTKALAQESDQQPVAPAVQQAPQATPAPAKLTPEQQAIADEYSANQQRIAALQELIRLQDRQKALAEAFKKLQAPPAPKPAKKEEKKK